MHAVWDEYRRYQPSKGPELSPIVTPGETKFSILEYGAWK